MTKAKGTRLPHRALKGPQHQGQATPPERWLGAGHTLAFCRRFIV